MDGVQSVEGTFMAAPSAYDIGVRMLERPGRGQGHSADTRGMHVWIILQTNVSLISHMCGSHRVIKQVRESTLRLLPTFLRVRILPFALMVVVPTRDRGRGLVQRPD